MKNTILMISTVFFLNAFGVVWGAEIKPVKPASKDKCPVCGMFVAKYPEFAAQIHFKDGTAYHFDGTKDFFRYYQNSSRYSPGKKTADVKAVFVTSYYKLSPINGLTAWYVTGSNINSPMGRELIPFAKEAEAKEFKRDHDGKAILRFKDVTPAVIKSLD
ncbi:MAG: nitrous oxide reductase accessory protein NosL [Desulfuromonadaceae bacterium]